MKIAYLVTRPDTIGGSHIHVRDMALALMKDGHEADIIMGGPGPVVDHYKRYGLNPIIIHHLKREISPISDWIAYKHILTEIKRLKPDIVSTHSSKAGFLGRLAANKLNIPVLFTAHGWSFTTGKNGVKRKFYKALENWVAPVTSKIITVSNYDRDLALKHLKLHHDKVVTINNGMPDITNPGNSSSEHPETVQIVKIARFDKQKDHIELLDAVHNLPGIHLNFIGDGPLMDPVKEHAARLNLLEKITFWGRLDSVNEVLYQSDIFVLISNWEGFPRSTLEAMRAGLPTIVSDVGGAAEAVIDGVTGYIVPKGDLTRLRTVFGLLTNDSEKRKMMGDKARKRFEELYRFETMYQRTINIYKELLNNHA